MPADFSPAEQANFIAAHVVGAATAFLEGRQTKDEMHDRANALMTDISKLSDDAAARAILDSAKLLVMAMLGTAAAKGATRQARWRDLVEALVKLVKFESVDLREAGAQRS